MALIALAADKGSPGVTTSAVALAAVWPRRALFAECDPHGGDLVYRMPAEHGGPLDPNRGLVSLAIESRRGLDASVLARHAQRLNGGLEILVGLGNADQVHGMTGLWGPLGRAFDRYSEVPGGADVIADCGRVGPDSPTLELLAQAALVLLVARTEAEHIAHVRDRANSLSARLHGTQGSAVSLARPPLGVVLIAPPNRARQAARQVGDLLAATTAGIEVLGVIARDEPGADALSGRSRGRVDKALLTRSARELAATVAQRYGLARAPIPQATPQPEPMPQPMPQPQPAPQPQTYAQTYAPAPAPAPYPSSTPSPSPSPDMSETQTITPIVPTTVRPAGAPEVPAMPPNLTSVPHPNAQPHSQQPPTGTPHQPQQYAYTPPAGNQASSGVTGPFPPTVSGTAA
jgi:hypothetical protein